MKPILYTKPTKIKTVQREWYFFDMKDAVLGRSATQIAHALLGKDKPYFVKHLDCGNHVVVVNAKYVNVTGTKETEKEYDRFSGYPSGRKVLPLWKVRAHNPIRIIREAVLGMLPKNKLRDRLMTRLHIYAEADHPYQNKFSKKG